MSKRIIEHPQETGDGPKYWRSFGQLEQTPEFKAWQEREFQTGASELNPEVGRRSFMKYMAASAALAGMSMSACRREEKTLVPFTQGVEWSVPGKPIFYATSRPHRRGAQPLVAVTHDGRPTKLDGNPLHALSNGASNLHTQAALLDLYDPDRSRRFQFKGAEAKEEVFIKWVNDLMANLKSTSEIAFLSEANSSPTVGRLADQLKSQGCMWVTYEPLSGDEAGAARVASFGENVRPMPKIESADVILALDSDFLGVDEGGTDTARAFAERRKPEQKMNRLYVVENRYTTTGGTADHRLRVQAGKVSAVARQFAEAIAKLTGDASLKTVLDQFPKTVVFGEKQGQWIEEAAKDLAAQKGKALVLVGYRQPAAVQALGHAINAALGALGATVEGRATKTLPSATIQDLAKALEERKIKTLFIIGGNPAYNAPDYVKTVTEDGKPKDIRIRFWDLVKPEITDVVRFGYYEDETTYQITKVDEDGNVPADGRSFVKWHVPAAHFLEAWGDGTAADGSHLSQQPMILPLFGGWSEIQLLNLLLTGKKTDGLELVQETFKYLNKGITPESWAKFLHDGFLANSASKPVNPAFNAAGAAKLVQEFKPSDDGIEVVFAACPKVDDGRYSNNAWMQELPDPITKLTWDNAALISPAMAKKLGFGDQGQDPVNAWTGSGATGEWVSIEVNKVKLEIPVYVAAGHADDSITIALGYGRNHEGRVGGRLGNYMSHGGFFAKRGKVGFNAYVLRTSAAPYIAKVNSVTKLPHSTHPPYALAVTQEHGAIEGRGADLVREATLKTFREEPEFARDKEWLEKRHAMDAEAENVDKKNYPLPNTFYKHPELHDQHHQWAMVIDLTTCTGCSACMIACQAENNIPVVGKEQVLEGRELHWIRMDRYFVSGMNDRQEKHGGTRKPNVDEPRMVMQPLPCQHCENAPCETVCPVNATVHSEDGLNIMAYNRCIGTRYCANNCPFKVRRFNFFDFNLRQKEKYFVPNLWNEKGMAETLQLSKNPNVTVRMRGVMEKCTFCVQRVQEARIAAKVKAKDDANVQVPTDSFTTACAQVCAAGAITFGNKKDKNSKVAKIWEDSGRNYRLLDYVGVKARVSYLARVTNINPAMPDVPLDYPELEAAAEKKGGKA
jgi:molybdopterin-containing oxidoreductase family iron-sulfur binding subunit